MTTFGVDYSFARPTVSALKSAGVKFAARYLSSSASKNLTASEAKALHDGGISIVVVWEDGANRASAGNAAGVADAKAAEALRKSIGMPSNQVIHFAVDFDTALTSGIKAYFQGVASVLGLARTGVYGGYKIVKPLFDGKLVSHGWQTYAWSSGSWDSRAQLQQYSNDHTIGGGAVDYDRAMVSSYGQWAPAAPAPAPAPAGAPIPSPKLSVDGKTSSALYKALQNALRYRLGSSLTVDGNFATSTVKELQQYLKITKSGKYDTATKKALQKHLSVTADGVVGPITIKAWETRLNAGTF